MSYPYRNLFQRLLANSVESETLFYNSTPCWCWTGHRQVRGYGRFTKRVADKPHPVKVMAHREMAQIVLDRPLGNDETIEHACLFTGCINYLHFKVCSNADNARDMQYRRHGKPRLEMKPLIDPAEWIIDPFIRALPVRRGVEQPCPPF